MAGQPDLNSAFANRNQCANGLPKQEFNDDFLSTGARGGEGRVYGSNLNSVMVALEVHGSLVGFDLPHRAVPYLAELGNESGNVRYDREIWADPCGVEAVLRVVLAKAKRDTVPARPERSIEDKLALPVPVPVPRPVDVDPKPLGKSKTVWMWIVAALTSADWRMLMTMLAMMVLVMGFAVYAIKRRRGIARLYRELKVDIDI